MSRSLLMVAGSCSLVLGVVTSGCVTDGESPRYGTYHATREVVESEPSPAFEIPLEITVDVGPASVTTSSGAQASMLTIDGTSVRFSDLETWSSREGTGTANLHYALDLVGDGTMSGVIAAHVIFDQSVFADFDYKLTIHGTL